MLEKERMPHGNVWEGAAGEASAEGGLGGEPWEADGNTCVGQRVTELGGLAPDAPV